MATHELVLASRFITNIFRIQLESLEPFLGGRGGKGEGRHM